MKTALIYAQSLTAFKTAYGSYTSPDADGYRAVAFTDDGYIITHGKIFKQYVANESGDVVNSLTIGNDGKLTISFGGETISSPANLVSGSDGISVTASSSGYAVKHAKIAADSTNDLSAASTVNNFILKLATIKYDKNFGHITGTSVSSSAIHLDYVAQTLSSSKFLLLGSTSESAATGAAVKNASAYIQADNNTVTLHIPGLNISGGASKVTLNNQTLEAYITGKVGEATTAAVVYKGTITPSSTPTVPASNPTNGDMYKVTSAGSIKLTASGAAVAVKAGDAVIYNGNASTPTWEIIPAGDEPVTFIGSSSSNLDTGNFIFTGSAVAYNASTKTFTITDTQYSDFVGFGDGMTAAHGLVPAPTAGGLFLKSNGSWSSISYNDLTNLPTIGTGVHTIAIGASGSSQSLANTFGANAPANVTTYIPLATQVTSTSGTNTWGAIKGYYGSKTGTGVARAVVVDGEVYYTNTTYSFSNLTLKGKNSNGTDASIKYNSQAARSLIFGDNLTVEVSGSNQITVKGTPNTWRTVKAWKLSEMGGANDSVDTVLSSDIPTTGTAELIFGSDFAYDSNGVLNLTWAEVAENGSVSYYV